tara:strand:- start:659 stop:901 length:243 start_codon:yes stop_codon:yes gene_type:complete
MKQTDDDNISKNSTVTENWYFSNSQDRGIQTEEFILESEDYREKLRSFCKNKYKIGEINISNDYIKTNAKKKELDSSSST